ncbi:hypothetical protein E3W21_04810 [Pseudomonas sp. F01002]|nr:hypothetical protein E3W21_04810 [Pseudomonas sp. F01002]
MRRSPLGGGRGNEQDDKHALRALSLVRGPCTAAWSDESPFSWFTLKPLWERACSRKRWARQHHCRPKHRFREQARSHKGFVLCISLYPTPVSIQCPLTQGHCRTQTRHKPAMNCVGHLAPYTP